jgi:DNA-binding PadR family transcriptional regulator
VKKGNANMDNLISWLLDVAKKGNGFLLRVGVPEQREAFQALRLALKRGYLTKTTNEFGETGYEITEQGRRVLASNPP